MNEDESEVDEWFKAEGGLTRTRLLIVVKYHGNAVSNK